MSDGKQILVASPGPELGPDDPYAWPDVAQAKEPNLLAKENKFERPSDMMRRGFLGETIVDDRARLKQSQDKLALAVLEFERAGRWLKIAEHLRCRVFRVLSSGERVRFVELEAAAGLVGDKKLWAKRRKLLMKMEAFGLVRLCDRRFVGDVGGRTFWTAELMDWCDRKFSGAEYGAAKVLFDSASAREKRLLQRLEQAGELERRARGLEAKANRQAACGLFAMRGDGSLCGKPRAYLPFKCKNRYCPTCAPRSFRDLLAKYAKLGGFVAEELVRNPKYRLRILDITAVKPRGGRMPTAREVRQFGEQVKKLLRRIEEFCGVKCGYLYCIEFGFQNENVHCHGLLLSPYVDFRLLSEWWSEIRGDGSYRVVIEEAKPMRADETPFESALKHALEYTGKYATFGPKTPFSPQRAVALELAFHGVRRVHSLGLFYHKISDDDKAGSGAVPCPCGLAGCFLNRRDDLGWFLVSDLQAQGLRDLDAEEVVSEVGAGPP